MASEALSEMLETMRIIAELDESPKFGAGIDYVEEREKYETSLSFIQPEPGITFAETQLNGVEVEVATPEKPSENGMILYLHGGGFTVGSHRTVRSCASILAAKTGFRVVFADYRLAPENHFPAAPEDCFSVYEALINEYPDRKIAVAGDSAGANLSLVITLMAMDKGLPLPACVTVFSPATDLTGRIDRSKYAETDLSIPVDIEKCTIGVYCPDEDTRNPYISPLYGDYTGFPPLKIIADKGEVLYEDSERLAAKAKAAGVEVDFQKWEGTFHDFPMMASMIPEGMQVLTETAEFIKKHI